MSPTIRVERHAEPARQSILRRQANRMKSRIPALAGKYRNATARIERAEQCLLEVEDGNPDFALSEARRTARIVTVLIGLIAVYILDFVLMSATVEDLVGRIGVHNSTLSWTLRALVPMMIMGLEVYLGVLWLNQRDEETDTGEGKLSYFWLVLGILTALVIPLGVATSVVAEYGAYAGDGAMQKVTLVRGLMLVLLAFCGHMTLLLGGRMVEDVRAETIFLGLQAHWNREQTSAQRKRESVATQVKTTVAAYTDALIQHNEIAEQDRALKAGPFSTDDCLTVNEIFGTEYLKVDNRGQVATVTNDLDESGENPELLPQSMENQEPAERPAAASIAEDENPDSPGEESFDDELRGHLQRMARDADSRVSP